MAWFVLNKFSTFSIPFVKENLQIYELMPIYFIH